MAQRWVLHPAKAETAQSCLVLRLRGGPDPRWPQLRLMTLIDEFSRECLAIRVARRINSFGVLETMADVLVMRGVPEHIRSDNGAEMTAKVVRNWLTQVGAKTLYIEPGSPWENGYCESSTGSYAMSC